MCSRYMNKPTGLKEKSKIVQPKIAEKKHLASYSQSWTAAPTKKNKIIQNKKNSSKTDPAAHVHIGHPRRPVCSTVLQQQFRGPNPSLPHLKYGLFKKGKYPNVDSADKIRKIHHEKKQKGEDSEPIYVVRHTEGNMHRLSRAASTHLDIKPQTHK